jgi:hypothetical protein
MGHSRGPQQSLFQKQRAKVIKQWADKHGSNRLKEQIAQGYEGWPLYLHERVSQDFPGAKLDKEAWDYLTVLNPTEEELASTRKFANRIVELGLADNLEDAFGKMRLRSYDLDVEVPDFIGTVVEKREVHCIVFNAYRPGSDHVFTKKTIRIDLP